MDKIVCDGKWCKMPKSLRPKAFMLSPLVEGGRKFLNSGEFQFENTPYNIEKAESIGLLVEKPAIATRRTPDLDFDGAKPARPAYAPPRGYFSPYAGKFIEFKEMEHQKEAFEKFKDLRAPNGKRVFGLFAEAGTGKTKIAVDLANYWYCAGDLSAVLVLAKKGVHAQWVEGQAKENGTVEPPPVSIFTQEDIKFDAHAWDGNPKKIPQAIFERDGKMKWLCINFDAIIHKKARAVMDRFLDAHAGEIAVIGDETHYWMTFASARTKAGREANHFDGTIASGLMTGTPLAKNLEDEWSQLYMLDPAILRHKYKTTFRNEFCVMGGFEGRQIVGSKNLDRFKELTAPYIFRVRLEDCVDLDPKQYRLVEFDLSREQKQAIAQLKQAHAFKLESGQWIEWEGAAGVRTKIQEVTNGYLTYEGAVIHEFENTRMKALLDAFEDLNGKALIWASFRQDVQRLMAQFGESAVAYYGGTNDKDRKIAKEAFMDKGSGVDYFVATSAAAEGLDGLQKVCSKSFYYSNTYNSIHRWQSEARIQRVGQTGSAIYYDLVCRGGVDYPLLRNLKQKTSFSEMVLDIDAELGI